MDKNQAHAFASDLQKTIVAVMAKHGITMAMVKTGVDSAGNMVIKIAQPKITTQAGEQQPTPNAVERYNKFGAKLGLPARLTVMQVGGKEYTLAGLSTDGARVKGIPAAGGAVVDLPLAAVQAAVSAAGAAKVAELDKAEQAQPDDVVDPDVTAFLAAIGKATKPTEGDQ